MSFVVKTLGCKANLYDSQLIEAELMSRGLHSNSEDPKICIVNSCSVTDEADVQSLRMARKMAKRYPRSKVVVTGCGAEVDPDYFLKSPEVDHVVSNRDKHRLLDLVQGSAPEIRALGATRGYEEMRSKHPLDREWALPQQLFKAPFDLSKENSGRTRAFLKIQEGCNSFCTFCIIPYGRGPSRSLKPREVTQQINDLVEKGVREVVLTATNLGDYGESWCQGREKGEGLADLVEIIFRETDLERLRVSSLDPSEIGEKLVEVMESNPRFCRHFHVSLQSPHSKILRLMKRRYNHERVRECLAGISKISGPIGGVFIGMDLIAGFPGEAEEDFQWTLETLAELPWTRIHVFPYSERKGTPATRLPGTIPKSVRKNRTRVINTLSMKRLESSYQQILVSSEKSEEPLDSVLIEGRQKGPDGTMNWWSGYSSNYLRVLIPDSGNEKENDVLSVRPKSVVVDRSALDIAFLGHSVP